MNKLYKHVDDENIFLLEDNIPGRVKGLYIDNIIVLHSSIETNNERDCVLAEELGHHYTSTGIRLNQSHVETIRQEKRARAWAYKNMIALDDLYVAFCKGVHDQYELASELGVTDEFLSEALAYYKSKYGLYFKASEYVVYFEPFGIMKVFPDNTKV